MADWDRVAKIVGMLGSAADGEVVNAARLIAKQGVKFSELAERVRGGGGGFFGSPETIAQAAAHKADAQRWRERAAAAEDKLRTVQSNNLAMKYEIQRLKERLNVDTTPKEPQAEKPSRPRERPRESTHFADVLSALEHIREKHLDRLSEWEREFINSVIERLDEYPYPLSDKQISVIKRICKRLRISVEDLQSGN